MISYLLFACTPTTPSVGSHRLDFRGMSRGNAIRGSKRRDPPSYMAPLVGAPAWRSLSLSGERSNWQVTCHRCQICLSCLTQPTIQPFLMAPLLRLCFIGAGQVNFGGGEGDLRDDSIMILIEILQVHGIMPHVWKNWLRSMNWRYAIRAILRDFGMNLRGI